MAGLAAGLRSRKNAKIRDAVLQHGALSSAGVSERLFAWLFSGLVYPQIWEDPEVDVAAMRLSPGHRVVTIASGGCNVLSYLTARPARIDAVDLNEAHIALNRLKLAGLARLPGHADFRRFFAEDDQVHNTLAYDIFLAASLDEPTRRYWNARMANGRRRIAAFNGNFRRQGLLGWFIATAHLVARLHGVDPRAIVHSKSLREQRRFFDERLAPLFDRPTIRFMLARRASLFGLGIPPAQYDELAAEDRERQVAKVLKARLEKLACHFPINENYFAWQAFARRYPITENGALPLYLRAEHFQHMREDAGKVHLHHQNITGLLAAKPARSIDRYVLLDAQDWMSDAQLNALWTEISRTADRGARVIFRTAGTQTILPARLAPSLLDQWRYDTEESERGTRLDRSAIYGGFHVYERRD
ncbi:DUF3419 family protein [Pararhizobium haloflavum]|uniref:DUF3419 family protein n=1 Tax=Pararhizobium haloflavum TaxID=2037914 RepID=UPI000C1A80A7|nr:DUF3419 family protein [Pararhizobium haloflavum]